MLKKKTKKFVDEKKDVKFQLVHRSQRDPLVADEAAPQRVLIPVENNASSSKSNEKQEDIRENFGIYQDDDYDYLQHLRDVTNLSTEWERIEASEGAEKPSINLPSSLFASKVEEKVGLLNRDAPVSGPRLDYDPDIVAAMDEDFDFDDPENQLEDDFMDLANAQGSGEDESEEEDSDCSSSGMMDYFDEENDEVGSLKTFKDEETKSRFSSYSMSSSVIKRNEQLTLLDDKFEHMYASYDDVEIGALDCEEIEGEVDMESALFQQYAQEFEKEQKDNVDDIREIMKNRLQLIEQEDDQDLVKLRVETREEDKWDCQSIISTYSNIYNHPKMISEPKGTGKIKIDPRTGIPKNVLDGPPGKLTAKALAQLDATNRETNSISTRSVARTERSVLSTLSVRPKDETPEERKERKKGLKEYRRERRIERKANTEAFKEEKKKQEKIMMNNRNNVQGNRIL